MGVIPQLVAVALVVGLAAAMAIGPTRQLMAQRAEIAETAQSIRRLERSSDFLVRRIEQLKDPDYLEGRARRDLGMARPGETVYVVVPPKGKSERGRDRSGGGAGGRGPADTGALSTLDRFLRFIGVQ